MPVIPYDDTGKRTYEKSCRKYGVVPSSNVLKRLQDAKDLDLKYYGLGPKGAMALSVAMVVGIQSVSHTGACMSIMCLDDITGYVG